MQSQDTQKEKVVSIFNSREKAKAAAESEDKASEGVDGESFGDIMERNRKNKERVEKERASANKGVLRSYRIKH